MEGRWKGGGRRGGPEERESGFDRYGVSLYK